MELITLDSNFHPVKLVENYQSLLWTERYSVAGDFELVSGDIENTMALLPRESYVSLQDSTVPMVVEAYKIEKPKGEGPKITVSGRSFDTVLERRLSVFSLPPNGQRAAFTIPADKASDAAYKLIRFIIGDSQARSNLPILSPAISSLDAIPQINLPLPADYTTGSTNSYEVDAGGLYEKVLDLISTNHHGIKAVRPAVDTKATADIEIYNGADLTATVVFDARFDQFDSSTYLLSEQASANIAYIYGSNGGNVVRKNTVGSEVSGLARRILLVDEAGDTTLNSTAVRTSRALIELYKNNATALFDGEIAEQVASGYGTKYHLGDILKLTGEYGLYSNVRVAEYIRSSDAEGQKAYPTFEVVDA